MAELSVIATSDFELCGGTVSQPGMYSFLSAQLQILGGFVSKILHFPTNTKLEKSQHTQSQPAEAGYYYGMKTGCFKPGVVKQHSS